MASSPLERALKQLRAQASRTVMRGERVHPAAANAAWRLICAAWYFVRQVSGDDAYERYGEHMLRAHPGQSAMTRSEYYRFRTEQKWNRVTRCC